MKKTRTVIFRCTEEEYNHLKKVQKKEGVSISKVLRAIIKGAK